MFTITDAHKMVDAYIQKEAPEYFKSASYVGLMGEDWLFHLDFFEKFKGQHLGMPNFVVVSKKGSMRKLRGSSIIMEAMKIMLSFRASHQ